MKLITSSNTILTSRLIPLLKLHVICDPETLTSSKQQNSISFFANLHLMMLDILIVFCLFIKIAVLLEMYSNIDLEIQKVDKSHITFICSCNSPPYGETVEISINSVSVASITFLQSKCGINRRTCNSGECACTSTQFNMTLMIPVKKSYSLTCQVRELQEQHGRLLKIFKTITLKGTDIVNETIIIEQIRISDFDSTNSNITITSDYFTRSQKSFEIVIASDIELDEFASTIPEDFSNDVNIIVHPDTSNESLLSYKTYASFKGSKPSNTDLSNEDAYSMESYASNSEEEYLTGNEDAENDSLLTDDDEWNKQIDSAQKESCNPGTNEAAVILDENTLDTSTGLFDTTTTSKPLNPIMASTTEPTADIIYQRLASDNHH